LKWVNNRYIKERSLDDVIALCLPFLNEAYDLSNHDENWVKELIAVYHDQLSYGKEIVELVSLFFEDELNLDEESKEFMQDESIPNTLKVFKAQLEALEDFSKENIQACIKATQKEAAVKGKMLYMPLRIATTGIMHGPDLASSIMLLGKEKVLSRL
ncbi:MAG: glutamate--tRNA ligase, partial [Coprobacillus sp.]